MYPNFFWKDFFHCCCHETINTTSFFFCHPFEQYTATWESFPQFSGNKHNKTCMFETTIKYFLRILTSCDPLLRKSCMETGYPFVHLHITFPTSQIPLKLTPNAQENRSGPKRKGSSSNHCRFQVV